jgi:hypothetical protein
MRAIQAILVNYLTLKYDALNLFFLESIKGSTCRSSNLSWTEFFYSIAVAFYMTYDATAVSRQHSSHPQNQQHLTYYCDRQMNAC